MAGGKETPRQKMIGMMYLVLTALLALNVSKAILDAFVAIEDNIQVANENEWQRGDEKLSELKQAAIDNSVPQTQKKAKLLLTSIAEIDSKTAAEIEWIDALKLQILKDCGEDLDSEGKPESIIAARYPKNSLKPIRMKLENVEGKDKYDEPMHLLIGEDITHPTGKGMELWKRYNGYRTVLTELVARSMPSEGKAHFFKSPSINAFKDQKDLYAKINKAIVVSNVHPDDQEAIRKIYGSLTKREFSDVGEVNHVHWIGKTFDHAPSVAALASLSAMQKEILTARADAVALIRQRVGGGEFAFNKVMALAYGPEVANAGEEVEVQVLMAAFDSDRQPKVVFNGSELSKDKIHDGKGHITTRGSGSEMNLSGTITILNKSGIPRTLSWEKKIKIMKPQGTVSLPQLNMLYRNYDNVIEGVASGYDETVLSSAELSFRKNGGQYVGRIQGTGRTATIRISGRNNVTGKTETMGTYQFRVSNLPQPTLYVGSLSNGSTATRSELANATAMFIKYPPEIPLLVNYSVVSWEVEVAGIRKPGNGKILSEEAKSLIRQAKPGNTVTYTVKYGGQASGYQVCSIKVK